ncbi:MAG: hypothetical protein VW378_00495 [bacterium]
MTKEYYAGLNRKTVIGAIAMCALGIAAAPTAAAFTGVIGISALGTAATVIVGMGMAPLGQPVGVEDADSLGMILNAGEKQSEDQGNVDTQFNLGIKYAFGQGVERNDTRAFEYYKLAADHGHAKAQFNVGVMYEIGQGVEQSDTQAVYFYKQAAALGQADAEYNLADRYMTGRGVKRNYTKAFELIKKAAKQRNRGAQNALGTMYAFGQGVEQSDTQAFQYYKLAADQGHAKAQFTVGVMYEIGQGVKQNYTQAFQYFKLAADKGHAEAQFNVGMMYNTGRGVRLNTSKAFEFIKKAAQQENAGAQNTLGYMYAIGKGVKQSDTQAVEFYKRAADQGHADAQFNLGVMYATGQGVKQSVTQAVDYFKLAADQGHAEAQNNLAEYEAWRGVKLRDTLSRLVMPGIGVIGTVLAAFKCRKKEEVHPKAMQDIRNTLKKINDFHIKDRKFWEDKQGLTYFEYKNGCVVFKKQDKNVCRSFNVRTVKIAKKEIDELYTHCDNYYQYNKKIADDKKRAENLAKRQISSEDNEQRRQSVRKDPKAGGEVGMRQDPTKDLSKKDEVRSKRKEDNKTFIETKMELKRKIEDVLNRHGNLDISFKKELKKLERICKAITSKDKDNKFKQLSDDLRKIEEAIENSLSNAETQLEQQAAEKRMFEQKSRGIVLAKKLHTLTTKYDVVGMKYTNVERQRHQFDGKDISSEEEVWDQFRLKMLSVMSRKWPDFSEIEQGELFPEDLPEDLKEDTLDRIEKYLEFRQKVEESSIAQTILFYMQDKDGGDDDRREKNFANWLKHTQEGLTYEGEDLAAKVREQLNPLSGLMELPSLGSSVPSKRCIVYAKQALDIVLKVQLSQNTSLDLMGLKPVLKMYRLVQILKEYDDDVSHSPFRDLYNARNSVTHNKGAFNADNFSLLKGFVKKHQDAISARLDELYSKKQTKQD